MKVTFEGSPTDVVREMRDFLSAYTVSAPRPGEVPAYNVTSAPPAPIAEPVSTAAADPKAEQTSAGETGPQSAAESVCPFCGKSMLGSKKPGMHRRFCKQNPNRSVHPMEGKVNPGLAKYRAEKKANSESRMEDLDAIAAADALDDQSDLRGLIDPSPVF